MCYTASNSLPAAISANASPGERLKLFAVSEYDLGATLTSGQAFRWVAQASAWEAVVAGRWVRLRQVEAGILAETAEDVTSWSWLADYLQVQVDLAAVLANFPPDEPLQKAVRACRGLRLLRQEPWECLAAFILSSTKQIVQIQQIVRALCECYGNPVPSLGPTQAYAFPAPERLAQVTEPELRQCRMGFRAPYLLAAAQAVSSGALDLAALTSMPTERARAALLQIHGVGRKIADCVLLFAYGFQDAFPVDVWIAKALRELYFPKRRPSTKRLLNFSRTHFGPYAGFAQQYLFHYMRTEHPTRNAAAPGRRARAQRTSRTPKS
jgi:N-glycosylase/DNA lyase